jgi:hypothetical protein
MSLTHSTQIPTAARGKVRALVKAHRYWPDYLIGTGKLSASITNAELIRFALGHADLTAQIEAVLGLSPQKATPSAQVFRTKIRIKTGGFAESSTALELEQVRLRHLTKVLKALEA